MKRSNGRVIGARARKTLTKLHVSLERAYGEMIQADKRGEESIAELMFRSDFREYESLAEDWYAMTPGPLSTDRLAATCATADWCEERGFPFHAALWRARADVLRAEIELWGYKRLPREMKR